MSKFKIFISGLKETIQQKAKAIPNPFRGRSSAAGTVPRLPEFVYEADDQTKRGHLEVSGHPSDLESIKPLIQSLKPSPPKPKTSSPIKEFFDIVGKIVVVTGLPDQVFSTVGFCKACGRHEFETLLNGLFLKKEKKWEKMGKLIEEARKARENKVDAAAAQSSPMPAAPGPVTKKPIEQAPESSTMVHDQKARLRRLLKVTEEIKKDIKKLKARGGGAPSESNSSGKGTSNGNGNGSGSDSE